MTGIALLAREQGHKVTGMDSNAYPPMSEVLARQGIEIISSYNASLLPDADIYIVGNVMRRGMPVIEELLNQNYPYVSAPQWLAENVLPAREVFAVSGTHGKTTTTALLARMLIMDGRDPSYLIAGAANDFELPARLGTGREFVIEADEYDSAFFDKRAKFIHYRPAQLIITSLEYDHADIYPDMEAMKKQFNHLLRTVPSRGNVFFSAAYPELTAVLDAECRARRHQLRLLSGSAAAKETLAISPESLWCIERSTASDGTQESWRIFSSQQELQDKLDISWSMLGEHNACNLLAATAAAHTAGVTAAHIKEAAHSFSGVARRLQTIGVFDGVELISDFAHHPSAIKATIKTVSERKSEGKLRVIVEPASHTMRLGVHQGLAAAVAGADEVLWFLSRPLDWDPLTMQTRKKPPHRVYEEMKQLIAYLVKVAQAGDTLVLMSNGSVEKLLQSLSSALSHRG